MPEGAEVRVVCDAINKKLPQLFDTAVIVENVDGIQHRYTRKPPKNWQQLQQPFILHAVCVKGKLLFFDFEILDSGEKWVGLGTLGMSGDYRYNSANHKHARLSFLHSHGDLTLVDIRCFASFRLVTPDKAKEAAKKIGWDLLEAPMPEQQWLALQQRKNVASKPVGEFLLSQDIVSGHGNIYRCETLYNCRVDPRISVASIPEDKWLSINYESYNVLQKAYKLAGTSIVDFTADGVEGQAQILLQVYGKAHCPKGHFISKCKQGNGSNERTTWFCEQCL